MKKQSIILEVRASEGGSDSKLLVNDLINIYLKSCRNNGFKATIVDDRVGNMSLLIEGNGCIKYFNNESGTHRFVRVPPTEKRGRTQTSTISVAIIDPEFKFNYVLDRNQVDRKFVRSSKKGGQNVNKVSSCVLLTHLLTGIQVKCQDTRDQYRNEELAWVRLEEKLSLIEKKKFDNSVYSDRYQQIGNSNRSSKRRTYRVKEDMVIDHITGKQCSFNEFSRGKIELLS